MRRSWVVVVFLIAVSSALAQNQTRTAPVAGTVLDPSGASVADAKVLLTWIWIPVSRATSI